MTFNCISKAIILLIIFIVSPVKSNPASWVIERPVDSVINNFEDTIHSTIDKIDSSFNQRSFDTRSHLLILLQNLEHLSKNLNNEIFKNISKEQQTFLINTQIILNQFKQGNLEQIEALQTLTTDMQSALATLPLSKRIPIVTRYTPSYQMINHKGTFQVDVSGSWLAGGNPKLIFGKHICKTIKKIDSSLSFECGGAVLGKNNEIQRVSGKLIVFRTKSFFQEIKGLLFKNNQEEKKEYNVSITAIPMVMGKAEVSVVVEKSMVIKQDRNQPYSMKNNPCQGARQGVCTTFNQTDASWKIDLHSVNNACRHSERSACLGVRNLSQSGFQVCGNIANNGNCIEILGDVVARDARGHVWGNIGWQEYKEVSKQEKVILNTYTLSWSEDQSIELSEGTVNFEIKVQQIDERVVIADKIGDFGWFKITKGESNTIVIRPKHFNQALEL